MSNLFLILIISFVAIVFAIALLAIAWLIKGKTKIKDVCPNDSYSKQKESAENCDSCSWTSNTNSLSSKDL